MSTTPGAYSNMLCGVNGPGGFFFKTYKGSEKVSLTCHLVFSLCCVAPRNRTSHSVGRAPAIIVCLNVWTTSRFGI